MPTKLWVLQPGADSKYSGGWSERWLCPLIYLRVLLCVMPFPVCVSCITETLRQCCFQAMQMYC